MHSNVSISLVNFCDHVFCIELGFLKNIFRKSELVVKEMSLKTGFLYNCIENLLHKGGPSLNNLPRGILDKDTCQISYLWNFRFYKEKKDISFVFL